MIRISILNPLKIEIAVLLGFTGWLLPLANTAQGDQRLVQKKAHQSFVNTGLGLTTVDGWDQVVVLAVEPAGSAELSGVQVGDVIQSIGGAPVRSTEELNEITELLKDGDQVEVAIDRLGIEELVLLEFRSRLHADPARRRDNLEPVASFEAVEAVQIENLSALKLLEQNAREQSPMLGLNEQLPSRVKMLETIKSQKREIEALKLEIQQLRQKLLQSANSMRF